MTDIIKVKNLSVSYEGKKIIENISFNVEDGDFLVIFGENGSGKSSLIKAMLSFNPLFLIKEFLRRKRNAKKDLEKCLKTAEKYGLKKSGGTKEFPLFEK